MCSKEACACDTSFVYLSLFHTWMFFISVFTHIVSQATDEVPMMQQQSVQQQKAAPGVGFQPWVQNSTSHPSFSQPAPAGTSRHGFFSFSLSLTASFTSPLPLLIHLCWSLFSRLISSFFAGNVAGMFVHSFCFSSVGLMNRVLFSVHLGHFTGFSMYNDRSRQKLLEFHSCVWSGRRF